MTDVSAVEDFGNCFATVLWPEINSDSEKSLKAVEDVSFLQNERRLRLVIVHKSNGVACCVAEGRPENRVFHATLWSFYRCVRSVIRVDVERRRIRKDYWLRSNNNKRVSMNSGFTFSSVTKIKRRGSYKFNALVSARGCDRFRVYRDCCRPNGFNQSFKSDKMIRVEFALSSCDSRPTGEG